MVVDDDIKRILQKEKDNYDFICLYKIDNCWFAFERSAFYLFSTSSEDVILKVEYLEEDNPMLFTAIKSLNGMKKQDNFHFDIVKESDSEIIVGCNVRCKGFFLWRNNMVSTCVNKDIVS